jgi:hypothetical protein
MQAVEEWAKRERVLPALNDALFYLHLYGCSWADIEAVRTTLYAGVGLGPGCFAVTITRRPKGAERGFPAFTSDQHEFWMEGGLILSGLPYGTSELDKAFLNWHGHGQLESCPAKWSLHT